MKFDLIYNGKEYRVIKDWPYAVTKSGEVLSLKTLNDIKGCEDSNGYKLFTARFNGNKKTLKVHRCVAETWLDNDDPKLQVNHIDGNKINNHISNLEWCTAKHNIRHSRHALKKVIGESNPKAKLTENDVREIRRLHKNGLNGLEISKMFEVGHSSICRILRRQHWGHVK